MVQARQRAPDAAVGHAEGEGGPYAHLGAGVLRLDDNKARRGHHWRQEVQDYWSNVALGDDASLHANKRRRAIYARIDAENKDHYLSFINPGQGRAG
jgi:hypothetical protein